MIDQGIGTFDDLDAGTRFGEGTDEGIVLPDFRAGSADVRQELAWTMQMKIAHRRGQQDDVARGKRAFENEFSQANSPGATGRGAMFF